MPTILLSDRQIEYSLTRKAIGSIRLRLKSADSFSVSAPFSVPQFVIEKFIQDHSDWIINHLPAVKKIPSHLTILNTKYNLIISKSVHDSVVIFEDKQQIFINARLQTYYHIKKLIDQKLRILAIKLIKKNLSNYNFKYSRVSVRNQTSRFGSCSHANNLNFNWQIILFPSPIFHHILLHELCHTIVKNHTKKFWDMLAVHDPDWKSHRLWLKREAGKIMIFS